MGLAAPTDPAATVVKGYRLKVHRISPEDVKTRRDAVARIVSRSLSRGV